MEISDVSPPQPDSRIVRIGSHTGKDQLLARLKQHFINEIKDRSIFRKNIGRALLNRNRDPYLEQWNKDLTSSPSLSEAGLSRVLPTPISYRYGQLRAGYTDRKDGALKGILTVKELAVELRMKLKSVQRAIADIQVHVSRCSLIVASGYI